MVFRYALILLLLATSCYAKSVGGVWLTHKTASLTPYMTSDYSVNCAGNVNVGNTIYTTVIADSLDSLYTGGYSLLSWYTSRDSLYADTSCLMNWEYIGCTATLSLFAVDSTADTIRVTVEQGNVFSSVMRDSGFTTYGLFITDTLFASDTLYIPQSPTGTDGGYTRMFTDTFTITKPFVRIKVKNLGTVRRNMAYLYLTRRLSDSVLSGSTGRYSIPVTR